MSGRLVVVKVGGSLLDWPELPSRLVDFLETRRNDRIVLVVGGGGFADVLRDLDGRLKLGEERSHALALRVLDLTAHLLESIVPGTCVTDDVANLVSIWDKDQVPILAPRRFLDLDDESEDSLPHAWTTTTDSIAARIAVRLAAGELVLLKSGRLGSARQSSLEGDTLATVLREAANLDLVDPEFPRAVAGLPVVTLLNIRETR